MYVQLGREVVDVAATVIKPGVTTDEIDRIVHEVVQFEHHGNRLALMYVFFFKLGMCGKELLSFTVELL